MSPSMRCKCGRAALWAPSFQWEDRGVVHAEHNCINNNCDDAADEAALSREVASIAFAYYESGFDASFDLEPLKDTCSALAAFRERGTKT